MRARHFIIAAFAFGAMTAFGGAALAQGIDGSPHDLGGVSGDNGEICVYCHTPHGARTDIAAPLWNKPATGSTYTTYDSTTIDGEVLAIGSVSIACLTCHDGTQARDAVINSPGRGTTAFTNGTGTTTLGTIGNIIANLGTDLTNDHPIGIQYGGFDPGAGQIDPDFKNAAGALQDNGATGAAKRWWVDTEATANGTRDKSDMILYTRDNAGTAQPFVECATCHDPHVNTSGVGSGVSFMRISNTNSAVCLACHTK